MTERQILFDSINVGGSNEGHLSQRPAAFGIFALQQVASTGARKSTLPVPVILKRLDTDFLVLVPLGRRIQFFHWECLNIRTLRLG